MEQGEGMQHAPRVATTQQVGEGGQQDAARAVRGLVKGAHQVGIRGGQAHGDLGVELAVVAIARRSRERQGAQLGQALLGMTLAEAHQARQARVWFKAQRHEQQNEAKCQQPLPAAEGDRHEAARCHRGTRTAALSRSAIRKSDSAPRK